MARIMTTKEVAEYLQLHTITICKHASEGKIPATKVGFVWRFEKDTIDQWFAEGAMSKPGTGKGTQSSAARKTKK